MKGNRFARKASVKQLSKPLTESQSIELIRRAAELRAGLRRFLHQSDAVLDEWGLTSRQYVLLLFVAAARSESEATVAAVAARLLLAENTVTELANRAERLGLVRRGPLADDRRAVCLTPTAEGRRRVLGAARALEGERRQLARIVTTARHQK
jgi:DNA-binding MarR family transcriptional regulator